MKPAFRVGTGKVRNKPGFLLLYVDMETALGYIALAFFVASIILWYISGRLLKRNNKSLSRTMVYIGGFLFSFALLSGLIAIAI